MYPSLPPELLIWIGLPEGLVKFMYSPANPPTRMALPIPSRDIRFIDWYVYELAGDFTGDALVAQLTWPFEASIVAINGSRAFWQSLQVNVIDVPGKSIPLPG